MTIKLTLHVWDTLVQKLVEQPSQHHCHQHRLQTLLASTHYHHCRNPSPTQSELTYTLACNKYHYGHLMTQQKDHNFIIMNEISWVQVNAWLKWSKVFFMLFRQYQPDNITIKWRFGLLDKIVWCMHKVVRSGLLLRWAFVGIPGFVFDEATWPTLPEYHSAGMHN